MLAFAGNIYPLTVLPTKPFRAVPIQKKRAESDKDFSGRLSISTNPIQMHTDSEFGCFYPTYLLWYTEDYALYFAYIHCYSLSGVYDKILMCVESRVSCISEHTRNSSKICVHVFCKWICSIQMLTFLVKIEADFQFNIWISIALKSL